MSNWISVKQNWPAESGWFLVVCNGHGRKYQSVDFWNGDDMQWQSAHNDENVSVTHYRALDPMPGESKNMGDQANDVAIIGDPVAYALINRGGRAKDLSFHLIKGVCETPLFLMPDKSISVSELWRERHDARRYRTLKDGFDGFLDDLSEVSEYEWDKILDDACGIK